MQPAIFRFHLPLCSSLRLLQWHWWAEAVVSTCSKRRLLVTSTAGINCVIRNPRGPRDRRKKEIERCCPCREVRTTREPKENACEHMKVPGTLDNEVVLP